MVMKMAGILPRLVTVSIVKVLNVKEIFYQSIMGTTKRHLSQLMLIEPKMKIPYKP